MALKEDHDVELVEVLGREHARAQLAQHVAPVLEPVPQVRVVQSALPAHRPRVRISWQFTHG